MAVSPHQMVNELHGKLLRLLAVHQGEHFQGLQQAARHLRQLRLVDAKTAKRLVELDAAYNINRHITAVSPAKLFDSVLSQLGPVPAQVPTHCPDLLAESSFAYFTLFENDAIPVHDDETCNGSPDGDSGISNDTPESLEEAAPMRSESPSNGTADKTPRSAGTSRAAGRASSCAQPEKGKRPYAGRDVKEMLSRDEKSRITERIQSMDTATFFAFSIDWASMLDYQVIERHFRPSLSRTLVLFPGADEASLTEPIVRMISTQTRPNELFDFLEPFLGVEGATIMRRRIWRMLIIYSLAATTVSAKAATVTAGGGCLANMAFNCCMRQRY